MHICQWANNDAFFLFFIDFVEATRNIFQENLEELGLGAGPFMFSYHEAASLMDTSAFHSPVSSSHCLSQQQHQHLKASDD